MWISILCTIIVTFVFIRMSFSYTKKRAQQRYSKNKVKAPSIDSFKHLSKMLFIFSMLCTVVVYWITFPNSFYFHQSQTLQIIGALLVLFGYFGLSNAFAQLDDNYSPLFDAYKPFDLTDSGVYAYIRHPIYAFNLCVSFGLALSSGVIFVAIAAMVGFGFVLRAIFIEEAYLKLEFDEYASYCNRTWRFIPYIF